MPHNGNAFGKGSPSWDLPFPNGNLTAAEILAYLPHWLKSIDVVDRFITNGGGQWTIAAMITEFRILPDAVFRPNSAQIMMSYNMRRAGFERWKVGTHGHFERPQPDLTESDLNVGKFRTPKTTHPRVLENKRDRDVKSVAFKALALHVKVHPSGNDALDLARCVQYAIAHPDEKWLFPRDFGALVKKLGGPATVTHSHFDRQAFARRAGYRFPPSLRAPKQTAKGKRKRTNQDSLGNDQDLTTHSRQPTAPKSRQQNAQMQAGNRRKSGRLAGKATVNLREYDSDTTDVDTPHSAYSTPAKKRKHSHISKTPGSPDDSDFVGDYSELDEDVPDEETASSDDELFAPAPVVKGRAAAQKARQTIRSLATETQRNIVVLKRQKTSSASRENTPSVPAKPYATMEFDPEIMALAHNFTHHQVHPAYLAPPMLSKNRLRVDASSIYLYAADGCTSVEQMWATALSSTRFGGPRRHPPFRELHRLTDPLQNDISDWAENIRWAKEQHRVFGSDTWTEYDAHLDQITAHRRETLWVSEEVIQFGM